MPEVRPARSTRGRRRGKYLCRRILFRGKTAPRSAWHRFDEQGSRPPCQGRARGANASNRKTRFDDPRLRRWFRFAWRVPRGVLRLRPHRRAMCTVRQSDRTNALGGKVHAFLPWLSEGLAVTVEGYFNV